MARIKLPADWRERIEQLASDEDERETVLREREVVTEQLRRLKQLYADLLIDDTGHAATACVSGWRPWSSRITRSSSRWARRWRT